MVNSSDAYVGEYCSKPKKSPSKCCRGTDTFGSVDLLGQPQPLVKQQGRGHNENSIRAAMELPQEINSTCIVKPSGLQGGQYIRISAVFNRAVRRKGRYSLSSLQVCISIVPEPISLFINIHCTEWVKAKSCSAPIGFRKSASTIRNASYGMQGFSRSECIIPVLLGKEGIAVGIKSLKLEDWQMFFFCKHVPETSFRKKKSLTFIVQLCTIFVKPLQSDFIPQKAQKLLKSWSSCLIVIHFFFSSLSTLAVQNSNFSLKTKLKVKSEKLKFCKKLFEP